jgi:hypothetical protein
MFFVRSTSTLDVAFSPAVGINQVEITNVTRTFDNVHSRLGSGEAIARIICGPAIDVIDLPVELVGYPKRLLVLASRHGMRSKENIKSIPNDQRQRHSEPCQGEK